MADRYWVAGGTGNYNSTTNWSATSGGASGASVPSTGDNVFFNASSGVGTATINVASNCSNLNLTGFTGTLSFTNTLSTNGTIVNLGTGGYTQAGVSGLIIQTSCTMTSGGVTWSRLLTINSSPTLTLADNWTVTGNITINSGAIPTLNNNTLNIGGNFTMASANWCTGTTIFNFNGTGTWSSNSGGFLRNNVTINTPSGTLTISGTVGYQSGTLTYTAGTVITTGSTLNTQGTITLNTNGITWNNINTASGTPITLGSNLTLTGTLSLGNGTTSFTLGGFSLISTNANLTMLGTNATFTMPANQTFKTLTITGSSASINANTLTITENLTINNALSGTTSIIYGGTGTWTANNAGSLINNILTINTVGTLTISGTVYKGSGLFTYTAGTIDDTSGTVAVQQLTLNLSGFTFRKLLVNNTITLASNLNATTFGTWAANAITFTLGGFSLNFTNLELGNTGTTTLPTAWVCQDIELVSVSASVLTSNSITITRNLTQSGAGAYTGTTTFIYNVPALSTGTWSRTGNSRLGNNLTINSAGTIDFTGGHIGAGIFTYTAGTFNCQIGSILYNSILGTTFNGAGITWYNVVFGLPSGLGGGTSVILNTQLICIGTLTLNLSQTTFSGTDGTFDTYNFVLGSDGTALRTTQLVSTKTYRVRQSFTCTQATSVGQILLRSTIGGSQAIFTLDSGSTIDVGFVNATDINSSLGRPIYSYKGVFSNTLNWGLLPTDNTRSGRFVYA